MAFEINFLAFLFGAGSGVVGNAVYDGIKSTKNFLNLDSRKKSVNGKWLGVFAHEIENKTYQISLKIKTKGKKVTGKAVYLSDTKRVLILEGGFYDDHHVYLQYRNEDKAFFQHGVIIAKLSGDAKSIKGSFLGVGLGSGEIVSGEITLNKKA